MGATLALCTGALATAPESAGNPYQSIVVRNVFNLHDPPPPAPVDTAKTPSLKITLTGIMTIFGKKHALMKAIVPGKSPEPGKPPEPAKEQSFMLAEHQAEYGIEVLAIDEKKGEVKVSNQGTEQALNFTDNGVKIASTPPPGTPGVPNPAGVPNAGPTTLTPPGVNPGHALPQNVVRPLRVPTSTGSTPTPTAANFTTGPAAQGFQTPTTQAQASPLSREEDAIHTEAMRELYKGSPIADMLPPTEATPPDVLKRIMAPGWESNPVLRRKQGQAAQ